MRTDEGSLVELDDGNWVDNDVLRVVERVQEYDPNLKIQYLSRADRLNQAPYRLMEKGKDGVWRPVFDVWTLDQRVMDRIYAMDTYKHDILGKLDKNNDAVRRDERRKDGELRDFHKEVTKAIIDSPKDTYTVPINGEVKKFTATPR